MRLCLRFFKLFYKKNIILIKKIVKTLDLLNVLRTLPVTPRVCPAGCADVHQPLMDANASMLECSVDVVGGSPDEPWGRGHVTLQFPGGQPMEFK